MLVGVLERPGQPVKRGTMAHEHGVYMALADVAVRLRDAEGLAEYAPRLAQLAERDGHRLYLAVAQRALGVARQLAGHFAAAAEHFAEALAGFEALGTRWQIGCTLFEMGALDLARADPSGARVHFTRALAEFTALGAVPDAERTRTALEALTAQYE